MPSVVYGKAEARNTQAGLVEITKAVHTAGKHTPITLKLMAKKLAIIQVSERGACATQDSPRSVPLSTKQAIVTEVPIRLVGQGKCGRKKLA